MDLRFHPPNDFVLRNSNLVKFSDQTAINLMRSRTWIKCKCDPNPQICKKTRVDLNSVNDLRS